MTVTPGGRQTLCVMMNSESEVVDTINHGPLLSVIAVVISSTGTCWPTCVNHVYWQLGRRRLLWHLWEWGTSVQSRIRRIPRKELAADKARQWQCRICKFYSWIHLRSWSWLWGTWVDTCQPQLPGPVLPSALELPRRPALPSTSRHQRRSCRSPSRSRIRSSVSANVNLLQRSELKPPQSLVMTPPGRPRGLKYPPLDAWQRQEALPRADLFAMIASAVCIEALVVRPVLVVPPRSPGSRFIVGAFSAINSTSSYC